jgi:VWFA-related protein
MITADQSSKAIGGRALIWSSLFLLALIMFSTGRQNWASPQDGSRQAVTAEKDFTIRVGVEEVRLDAVILDKNGHQVTDLTADDLEIRQDGLPQKITSCIYINDYQPQPAMQAAGPQGSRTMPPVLTPMPRRENVRRTIAFVVNNLTMQYDQVHLARMGLQKFVETQMQPGDLVTIVPTAGGNAALQVFSSDKRHLLLMINNLRWFIDTRTTTVMPQFMAVSYCIQALRNMPGRKSLIMMSGDTMLASPLVTNIGTFNSPISEQTTPTKDAFNPLADAALRAGVVIHTLDIHGLEGPEWYDPHFGAEKRFPVDASQGNGIGIGAWTSPGQTLDTYIYRRADLIRKAMEIKNTETPIPLSEKTGGLFIRHFNWFDSGIGAVNEELKGYYMLTYTPPANTFKVNLKDPYRRIKIIVKRPKCEVHTRDGFFGISQPANPSVENPGSLRAAIYSPFQYNDLNVNLASGYIEEPQKGYLLQSWLHLDGKALTIIKEKDGGYSISIEAACVTSDINNAIQDSNARQYKFSIKEENIPWIKEHGLRFSLTLPVKNPGAYYVRTAIKDLASAKMGSAYQFVEIPDLKKRRLSLSNIFFINRDEDLPWIRSGGPQESQSLLYPDMQRDPRKSPALRSYLPGENFEYAAMIYNAETGKEQKPDLESQYLLFENGRELLRSQPETVDLSGVADLKRIPITKKLTLGNSIQPGDYVLQLLVMDRRAKKQQSVATQALDFRVLAK